MEVAERQGCAKSYLVQRACDIPWDKIGTIGSLGITAGASAPEELVNEVIDAFRARYTVTVEVVTTAEEHIAFNVPRELRDVAAVSR